MNSIVYLICLTFFIPVIYGGFDWSEEENIYEMVAEESGHCIWYGNCMDISLGRHAPCYYTGSAKLVHDNTTKSLLKEWCPMYLNSSGDSYTCCDKYQLQDLEKEFSMMQQMMGRCPSCFLNLSKLFCALSCDPNQSTFIIPKTVFPKVHNQITTPEPVARIQS